MEKLKVLMQEIETRIQDLNNSNNTDKAILIHENQKILCRIQQLILEELEWDKK